MINKITQLKNEFLGEAKGIKDLNALEQLELKFLGRKNGLLSNLMKELKDIPKEEIAEAGQALNAIKNEILLEIEKLKDALVDNNDQSFFDLTLPGKKQELGHLHLATYAIREISSILEKIGFQRMRYPEVEWDYYAFETLNMPGDHPARDEWETFFIDRQPIDKKLGQRILTPHTSSGQVREMEKNELPIRMMNISKTYRRQSDVSHVPMFHQFEGLVVDKDINITHLKGVVDYFVKQFFGPDRTIRLRPHHFQFTEPSFEIDVSCGVCGGKGCKLCKEGWLEIGGAGMVHPNVLKAGDIDPKEYSGFAFGWGVERCFMMKAGLNIDDIRLLYRNDLRVNEQF